MFHILIFISILSIQFVSANSPQSAADLSPDMVRTNTPPSDDIDNGLGAAPRPVAALQHLSNGAVKLDFEETVAISQERTQELAEAGIQAAMAKGCLMTNPNTGCLVVDKKAIESVEKSLAQSGKKNDPNETAAMSRRAFRRSRCRQQCADNYCDCSRPNYCEECAICIWATCVLALIIFLAGWGDEL